MTVFFFDVDGVLIDGMHTDPARRTRWDTTLQADLGIDPEDLVREFFLKSFMDVIVGKRDCLDALTEVLPSISDGSVPAQTLLDYWLQHDSKLNPHVIDIVQQLSNHPDVDLYIATNQEHYRTAYLWNDLGFKNTFKDIYYSARLGCLKTDPAYFQTINAELDLDGRDILFFDDTQKNLDVAAQEGWQGCLVKDHQDIAAHPLIHKFYRT